MLNQKKLEDFLKKAEKIKQSGSVDLSSEEDLVLAIMNLHWMIFQVLIRTNRFFQK